MISTNRLVATALIADFAVYTIITGTAIAQSKPGANASDTASTQVVNGPETDPNMPQLPYAIPGALIQWTVGGDTPDVTLMKPYANGTYLGFNEKGSWIRNDIDRKV